MIFKLFIVIVVLFPTSVIADTRVCDKKESKILLEALDVAKSGILKSLDIVESNAENDKRSFEKWFGSKTPASTTKVKKVLTSAAAFMSFQGFYCPYKSTQKLPWEPGELAFVILSDLTKMYFSPQYFQQPVLGYNSQAGIIVHEMTHYSITGNTGDDNGRYGTNQALSRAKNNPSKALETADNYEYFVEEIMHSL